MGDHYRKKSAIGYYHVMMRGNRKEKTFLEDRDYYVFLKLLKRYTDEFDVKVICYCLMTNHVHLLLYDPDFHLSELMKKFNSVYAKYFNSVHEYVGHIYQDNFKSEPINDEKYFLTAFRYILNNPVAAKLCISASQYQWSSYRQNLRFDAPYIVSDNILFSFFSSFADIDEFIRKYDDKDKCLDIQERFDTYEEARGYVIQNMGIENPQNIIRYPNDKRKECIRKMKESGLTVNQISFVTRIPVSSVYRILKQ